MKLVEKACVAHYENWSKFHQWEREAFRKHMQVTVEAILNEESEGWDLKFRIYHASDCAKNNMPATPNGDCNCGALPDAVPKNFEEWPGPSDHDDWRDYGYERGWNAYRDALLAAPTRSADGGEK